MTTWEELPMCGCNCHTPGTVVRHIIACCGRTYEKRQAPVNLDEPGITFVKIIPERK